jgi:hypothetical protein
MKPATAVLLLPSLAAAGCHGCHDDHPYVPYSIDEHEPGRVDGGQAASPVPSAQPPAAEAGAPFAGEAATLAPPGLARWPVGGLVLDAPQGLVFVSAVVRDFDGDGAADAFAVVRAAEAGDAGRLAFYRGGPGAGAAAGIAAQATFAPPAEIVRDGACAPVARLAAIGKKTVLAELGSQCPPRPSSAPDRWVAVVDGTSPAPPGRGQAPMTGATPRVRLAVTVVDPPAAPALSIDGEASDRDGDGLDDVALRVTLEGGSAPLEPGPRVSATLAWLDRPAGPSRDAGATEASFASLASQAAVRAKSAKDAPTVPVLVAQTRALWRALCADGAAPRLVGVTGTGSITCGSTRALEEAGLAEVKSQVTMGDPLRAALALDRAERAPAARTASRAKEARGWIESLASAVAARSVRAVAAVPVVHHGHEPAWGALAFEASGKLLVRTRAGVVRVDPDAGDEAAADDTKAWGEGVSSPDGALRWIETYDACDGVALHATFASGDDVRDVALPVAPSLGERCTGSRGAPARALPVAWGPGGLEAIVEGQPVLVTPESGRASLLASFLDSPSFLGGPRSPDGKTLVVPTSAGLLVRGASRTRLLRSPELDGAWADQRDCAVSNDGAHVACVRAGKAWVGTWDAP